MHTFFFLLLHSCNIALDISSWFLQPFGSLQHPSCSLGIKCLSSVYFYIRLLIKRSNAFVYCGQACYRSVILWSFSVHSLEWELLYLSLASLVFDLPQSVCWKELLNMCVCVCVFCCKLLQPEICCLVSSRSFPI